MTQPLIFTELKLIPRLLDILLTLMAWAGFIYMIYNGLINYLVHSPYSGIRPILTTFNTVTFYAIVAIVNGLVLIGWAKYNQLRFRVERRSRRPGLEENEVADSLHIATEIALELNKGRVLTVFHNESGEIVNVEVTKGIMDNLLPAPVALVKLPLESRRETSEVKI